MGILRDVFGPSKKEIWKSLCEQTGNSFVEGGLFAGSDKVIAKHKDWTITLDTLTVMRGRTQHRYTRMRAPYINADGFRFSIYRSCIINEIAEFIGFHDIETGNNLFDKEFVIKANNQEKVKSLLKEPRLRELISQQSCFHLAVKDDEGWFGSCFPEGVDMLSYKVPGFITDIEELKGLFEIFSEVLDRLCLIGSAYHGNTDFNY